MNCRSDLTHLSLFSGIGGLDLAAEWAGFRSVGQCERADFLTKILEKHWPDVPKWRDIHELTGEDFRTRTGLRTVDVISGGFPCQPFSVAGKQKGKEDERYLWPEMLRVIAELKPRFVVGENVPGILRIAAADVVESLEREGYECVLFDFEAAAVGAHHRRERIAFVAHRNNDGPSASENARSTHEGSNHGQKRQEQAVESERLCATGNRKTVADTSSQGLQGCEQPGTHRERPGEWWQSAFGTASECGTMGNSTTPGLSNRADKPVGRHEQIKEFERPMRWAVEPDVGRVANGVPNRVDRIKALGNAVVPQQFYPIFKAIAEELRRVDT